VCRYGFIKRVSHPEIAGASLSDSPHIEYAAALLLPIQSKNGSPAGKPLIHLVAGEGFEPSTFGL
jgi:hypothetical protein